MNACAPRKSDLKNDPELPRERPILFSGPMVKAILEGRKTQTRRLVKMTPEAHWALANASAPRMVAPGYARWEGLPSKPPFDADNWNAWSAYGVPGDRLWVRESWRTASNLDDESPSAIGKKALEAGYEGPWAPVYYEADGACLNWDRGIWGASGKTRRSIHMPRWASRLTLKITDVRLERLHDISDEDAIAEGCPGHEPAPANEGETIYYYMKGRSTAPSPRAHFMHRWGLINGKRAPWALNPFVWDLSFRVVL